MRRLEAIAPEWRERLASGGLNRLESLLERSPAEQDLSGKIAPLTKSGLGGRERWRWEFGNDDANAVVFLKRYSRTPLRGQWDRIWRQDARHSHAYWEFEQSQRLADAHIPVPTPIGFVEEMFGRFERRSAVLLARVGGDAFERVWERAERAGAPVTRGMARQDTVRRLARFVAAFHGTGVCHRDLYLCHIFVDLDTSGRRPPAFALIDLARTHRPWWRRMRWIIKDLAQLDASARRIRASRADRYRFLLTYLGLERKSVRARWYARRAGRKSDRILRRDERKRRSG